METRSFGATGEKVSIIGLGGAYLNANSFDDGVATVHRALDLGVSYFDTSPFYGHGASQAVLGEALKDESEGILVATKLGYFGRPGHFRSPVALATQMHENLRLLRRNEVDVLQLHEADFHVWWSDDNGVRGRIDPERSYAFAEAPAIHSLRRMKADGRARFIGVTGNSAEPMARVLEHLDVDAFLLAFNYDLIRREARKILPIARENACACLVGGILAHGLIRPQPEILEHPPGWMRPEWIERYRKLYRLQEESGIPLPVLSIRFLVAQPEMDVIIVGARSPEEIETCVRAAEQGPLPEDLHQALEALGN